MTQENEKKPLSQAGSDQYLINSLLELGFLKLDSNGVYTIDTSKLKTKEDIDKLKEVLEAFNYEMDVQIPMLVTSISQSNDKS